METMSLYIHYIFIYFNIITIFLVYMPILMVRKIVRGLCCCCCFHCSTPYNIVSVEYKIVNIDTIVVGIQFTCTIVSIFAIFHCLCLEFYRLAGGIYFHGWHRYFLFCRPLHLISHILFHRSAFEQFGGICLF